MCWSVRCNPRHHSRAGVAAAGACGGVPGRAVRRRPGPPGAAAARARLAGHAPRRRLRPCLPAALPRHIQQVWTFMFSSIITLMFFHHRVDGKNLIRYPKKRMRFSQFLTKSERKS